MLPVILALAGSCLVDGRGAVPPPAPCRPVPSARQLAWQDLEFYGFLHFTVNTFTDKEWGYGDEDPSVFNPTALDARQWARVARDAGMKALIITAKHHDGFCLWPSQYTEHSVKHSPWKGGKGDVVKEVSAACREYGLKFGVYLSPWDRNRADYGRPSYITYYRNQLRELLTHYGPVFEVWFDGANGGSGYYGGARETRRIDRSTYYDWPDTIKIVRQLQPQAVIFSDAGPDVRWVGNERGIAFRTNWLTINLKGLYPGAPGYTRIAQGSPDGKDWVPPEVDVSIRPGWFYHPSQDSQVKSVDQLLNIYYQSVGHGANLLLNIPPDRRGLIAKPDVQHLREFRRILDATFKTDLARQATARASAVRGDDAAYAAANVNDGDNHTYWATDDGVTTGWVELDFAHPVRFDRVVLAEELALGQRVEGWRVAARTGDTWKTVGEGATIGHKRILRCAPVETRAVRVAITKAKACPTLASVGLYLAPSRE